MKASKPKASLTAPRRLTVDEARKDLHGLVKEFRAVAEPGDTLLDHAVEVGPHRKGGLLMVPEVDARAAIERIDELEEELEQIGMAMIIEQRRSTASPDEYRPLDDLIRHFGFEDLLQESDTTGRAARSG
jgi:hypothetical protein